MKKRMLAIFLTDSYKASHIFYTTPGVKKIYSNFTPRFTHHFKSRYPNFKDEIVWFGVQAMIKEILIEAWEEDFFKRDKEEMMKEASEVLGAYIGMDNLKHFADLHDLGYLPLSIKSLPEGSLVQPGIPCMTIVNTHDDFQWLPNYLESIITTQLWKQLTSATVGNLHKRLSEDYALETTGSVVGTEFQNHDFSLRGQSGYQSAGGVGAGFLLSSYGTDNIPALFFIKDNYNTDLVKDTPAFSIPAGEHSVTTLGIQIYAKKLINDNPHYSNIAL